MENILLRFCRETNNYTQEELARVLDITLNEYAELEEGKTAPTMKQVRQLELFYNIDGDYFYESALAVFNYNMQANQNLFLKNHFFQVDEELRNAYKILKKAEYESNVDITKSKVKTRRKKQ